MQNFWRKSLKFKTKICKICVVTPTRAEYGLLKKLIYKINKSKEFELQLVVTGTHLLQKFGESIAKIESDGFKISKKINLNLFSDTSIGISKSSSKGIVQFTKIFKELKPSLVIVLGDRY